MMEYNVRNLKLVLNDVEITDWYTDMEKYIREYKHLIGCEVKLPHCSVFCFRDREFEYMFKSSHKYFLSIFKFYLSDEEDSLVDYETYMCYHYPEYEHIWREQLC